LDLNAFAGAEAMGTLGYTGIYEHKPGFNEFLDPGAADVAETIGDSVIEALARIVFGGDEFMKRGVVALVHAEIVAALANYAPVAVRELLFGDVVGVVVHMVFVKEEDVDDDEGGADGDGGIGDVESGPVVAAEPDFEEVGDSAVDDAVGYVAGGAAEQQREAGSGEGPTAVTGDKQPGKCTDDCSGSDYQHNAHGHRGRISEDTESDSGVTAVHQVDEIVDQFAVPAFDSLRFEPGFAGAVEEDDGQGEPEPAETSRDQASSPSCGCMAGSAFDFGEGFGTTLADCWVPRVLTDVGGIVPAALALLAVGFLNRNAKIRGFAA